jgi:hypothetical protein
MNLDLFFANDITTLAAVKSAEQLQEVLPRFTLSLPVTATCPEVPYFPLTPPTYAPSGRWPAMLSDGDFPDGALDRLFASEKRPFMPLDLEMFNAQTSGNSFFAPLTKSRCVLLDTEYGIAPYAKDEPVWANVAFTRLAVERLFDSYPEIKDNRNLFLSLGAVRMARVIPKIIHPTRPDEITTVHASTREELENFLTHLQRRLDVLGVYQLWYRGQNDDFLLDNFQHEARAGICPWRSVRDTSLIPSLYRELPKRLDKPWEYAAYCREYALYSMFLDVDLGLVEYTSRGPADVSQELLKGAWMQNVPQPTWATLSDGSRVMSLRSPNIKAQFSKEAKEVRDYHPVFNGLQKVFFMQHYGLASNVLDITHSLDVALFFAENQVSGKSIMPVDRTEHKPVIYLFLLRPDVDLFLNSQVLSKYYNLLRPQRQSCGLLFGSSFIHRNDYSRFVAMKIVLDQRIRHNASAEYLVPSRAEDAFLDRLITFAEHNNCTHIRPWVYEPGKTA